MEVISNTLIGELEELSKQHEQIDCRLEHIFSNGIYIRELHIPKGTLVVGKRHRESTLNILLKGKMSIIDGDTRYDIEAPYIFTADKYSKKAGYTYEDSIWLNIHKTDSTDLEDIESQFIITEDEYVSLQHKEKVCLG